MDLQRNLNLLNEKSIVTSLKHGIRPGLDIIHPWPQDCEMGIRWSWIVDQSGRF